MNIIQKKIKSASKLKDSALAETYAPDLGTVFTEGHRNLCQALTKLTQIEWEPGNLSVEGAIHSDLLEIMPEHGLNFGFSRVPNIWCGHIGFCAKTAEHAMGHALKVPHSLGSKVDYRPSRLDLLLFQPLVKRIQAQLQKHLTTFHGFDDDRKMYTGLNIEGAGLTKQAVAAIGPLAVLTFGMRTGTVPTEKAKAQTVRKDLLRMFVVLPQKALTTALEAQNEKRSSANQPIIDIHNPWALPLCEAVKSATSDVRVVVETFEMSVADCTRLEIGQTLSLPGVTLESLSVEVDMCEEGDCENALPPRQEIARATLGIYKSSRAVRLNTDPDSNFVDQYAATTFSL